MIKFDVFHRLTGSVNFTGKIDCAEDAPHSIKLGLAVQWGLKNKANLTGANLTEANLAGAKEDFYKVLAWAAPEAPALLTALREGKIDGSTYQGSCACLVGTIANARGCDYRTLETDASRPIERLFINIRPGHVPAINPVAKIVEDWLVGWLEAHPQPVAPARSMDAP